MCSSTLFNNVARYAVLLSLFTVGASFEVGSLQYSGYEKLGQDSCAKWVEPSRVEWSGISDNSR